ncbi:hypothetical protein FRB94_003235 [Tulasnella sp. JGI-2019a]|nr:hypothetical protein FRB94_003235 [Tulasnella sp. JGI-2019a]KAG9003683.1 hypothetical protein FRB93_010904 [Tulasnella sp. JGI-2019a]KAG9031623.1 hypothetical protein FRB95_002490 [Tulasnella sp. JGI-2019a]
MKYKTSSSEVIKKALELISEKAQSEYSDNVDGMQFLDQSKEAGYIDRELASLYLARRSLLAKLNVHELELKSRRNTFSPIHQLPVEILTIIFRDLLAPTSTRPIPLEYFETPHILSKVCTAWREIMNATPDLWAVADSFQDEEKWMTALTLSKNQPLVVNINTLHKPFWCAIAQNVQRWGIVLMEGRTISPSWGSVVLALQTPAPSLTEFKFWDSGWSLSSNPATLDLFGGIAPRLQNLSLHGLSMLNWRSPIFSGLRSLSISFSAIGPSPIDVLWTLQRCPDLESLLLSHGNFRLQPPIPDMPSTINLPQLHTVEFLGYPSQFIGYVLRNTSTPRCTQCLVISYTLAENSPPLLSALASSIRTQFISYCYQGKLLDIRQDPPDHLVMTISPGDPLQPEFSVDLSRIKSAHLILNILAATPSPHRPLQASLTLAYATTYHSELFDTLRLRLPYARINTLLLEDWESEAISQLLIMLSGPVVVADDAPRWLCPALEYVQFGDCTICNPASILHFVEARSDAANGGRCTSLGDQEGIEERIVSNIRQLDVVAGSGMDRATFACLRNLLGSGAYWDKDKDEGDHENVIEDDGGNAIGGDGVLENAGA